MNTFCALILCTAAVFANTAVEKDEKTVKTAAKRKDYFGEFALAEYLFKRADVNKDSFLTKNEIYNFYRHDINWPFDKAANMSITLMKIGDVNNDQKLDEIVTKLLKTK